MDARSWDGCGQEGPGVFTTDVGHATLFASLFHFLLGNSSFPRISTTLPVSPEPLDWSSIPPTSPTISQAGRATAYSEDQWFGFAYSDDPVSGCALTLLRIETSLPRFIGPFSSVGTERDLDFNNLPSSICGDYELHVPFIMLTGWHRVTATRQEQHLMARSLLKESPGPVSLSTECCEKHCGDKENLNGSFTDDQGDSQIYVRSALAARGFQGRTCFSRATERIRSETLGKRGRNGNRWAWFQNTHRHSGFIRVRTAATVTQRQVTDSRQNRDPNPPNKSTEAKVTVDFLPWKNPFLEPFEILMHGKDGCTFQGKKLPFEMQGSSDEYL
ncbi:hypothetical protein MG293_011251 [Ovis ammon polii]|uniref:Uncharacterized protein n=1 Tax=Ovis ammon polii TaxID=230172 RepID=A0AAD4U742_OVIAM|nr:hypothetical protein MG293_011251 [Ovis ammon polii]